MKKVPAVAGGTVTTLTTVVMSGDPSGIAVDSTNVYWTNYFSSSVVKIPTGGGTASIVVTTAIQPGPIKVDATNVYWINSVIGGSVTKVRTIGGAQTTLAWDQRNPAGIALDSSNVYWTTQSNSGTVMKVSITGGSPTTLASGQPTPWGIAVDANYVYWATNVVFSRRIKKPFTARPEQIVVVHNAPNRARNLSGNDLNQGQLGLVPLKNFRRIAYPLLHSQFSFDLASLVDFGA